MKHVLVFIPMHWLTETQFEKIGENMSAHGVMAMVIPTCPRLEIPVTVVEFPAGEHENCNRQDLVTSGRPGGPEPLLKFAAKPNLAPEVG